MAAPWLDRRSPQELHLVLSGLGGAAVAGRIGRQTLVPKCRRYGGVAIFVLIFDRYFAVPPPSIGCLRSQPVGTESKIKFSRLAFVLQSAARSQIGVIVKIIEHGVENELLDVFAT